MMTSFISGEFHFTFRCAYEVETSSLSDVYPLTNIAGEWHKGFETSSLPPVLAQSANSAQFSADFETSSLPPFDLST